MAVQPRAILKEWFETGDKPTQSQFADLIDSMLNIADDDAVGGLRPHDVSRPYIAGDCVVYAGKIYQAIVDTTGAFDIAKWTEVPVFTAQPGLDDWDNPTTYDTGDLVIYQQKIYRSLVDSNQGQIPSSSPTFWEEISAANDSFAQDWIAALYRYGQVVRVNDMAWRYIRGTVGDWNLSGIGTTFEEEVEAGYWQAILAYHGVPYSIDTLNPLHIYEGRQHIVIDELINEGNIINEGQIHII